MFNTNLVSGHNQTKEFEKKLGSTLIDEGVEFAKPLISESIRNRRVIFPYFYQQADRGFARSR
jgi:hypothetical protein